MSLDTTIKAVQGGLVDLGVAKGVKNIDTWMETLEKADFRGAKAIHDNLGKLKAALHADPIDGSAVAGLLHTLGEETKRAASHAEGKEGEKITQLGELLSSAGGDLGK